MSEAFNPVLAVLRIRDALQGVDGYELDSEIADCEALLCFLYTTRPPEPMSPEERKRASKAARQAKWRAKKASTDASRVDIGVDSEASTERLHVAPDAPSRASESLSEISQSSLALGSISESQKESESARELAVSTASHRASTRKSTAPKPQRWTRVPPGFVPTAEAIGLATTLGVNLEAELAKFRDHEYAKPKTDADAAFRTWLRNAAQWSPSARPANGHSRPVRGAMAPVSSVHDKGRVDVRAALEAMEKTA